MSPSPSVRRERKVEGQTRKRRKDMEQKVKDSRRLRREKRGNDFLKSWKVKNNQSLKKKKKKNPRKNEKEIGRRRSRQPYFTSSWLQLAGVLSDAHSPSLSLVREDVFFCLLYACIYEVVGDLRALSITAFYCLNVDCLAPCA